MAVKFNPFTGSFDFVNPTSEGGDGITDVVEDTTPQLGGNLDLNTFTVGDADATDLTKLSELTATATELNYTDGVTSAIQTQLGAKQPLDADLTTIAANITAAGHALIDDADAAAQRTTLGLVAAGTGDIWVEKAGDQMSGALGVGIAASGATLHVKATADSIAKFGDGTSDARFELLRDTGSGAVMQFHAGDAIMESDGNWQLEHADGSKIKMKNAANGSEVWVDTQTPSIYTGGADALILGYSQAERMRMVATGVVINENAADLDTRIEGDTDANLIMADASTDRVGIGVAAPTVKLDVSGDVKASNFHIDNALADDTQSGIKTTFTAGETLALGNVCYMKSDGKMWLADADAIATASAIALATGSVSADASGTFLLFGIVRDDSAYNFTIGGLIYLSTTPGGISQTAVSATDDVVQVLGVALSADKWYFNPQLVQVEHV